MFCCIEKVVQQIAVPSEDVLLLKSRFMLTQPTLVSKGRKSYVDSIPQAFLDWRCYVDLILWASKGWRSNYDLISLVSKGWSSVDSILWAYMCRRSYVDLIPQAFPGFKKLYGLDSTDPLGLSKFCWLKPLGLQEPKSIPLAFLGWSCSVDSIAQISNGWSSVDSSSWIWMGYVDLSSWASKC